MLTNARGACGACGARNHITTIMNKSTHPYISHRIEAGMCITDQEGISRNGNNVVSSATSATRATCDTGGLLGHIRANRTAHPMADRPDAPSAPAVHDALALAGGEPCPYPAEQIAAFAASHPGLRCCPATRPHPWNWRPATWCASRCATPCTASTHDISATPPPPSRPGRGPPRPPHGVVACGMVAERKH
jgi:hypothetical protein